MKAETGASGTMVRKIAMDTRTTASASRRSPRSAGSVRQEGPTLVCELARREFEGAVRLAPRDVRAAKILHSLRAQLN